MDGFWCGFGFQIEAKIYKKSVRKGIKNKIRILMHFGWLLDPSWTDFGGQVGAKLAPKSVQEGVKTDVEKQSKKLSKIGFARACEIMQRAATNSPSGPLRTLNPRVQGTLKDLRTLPLVPRGTGADIFIYIYIYIYI